MVVSRLLPFLVQEAPAREAAVIPFETAFSLVDESGVGYGAPLRVSHIRRDAHIDSKHRTRGDMADAPINLEDELGIVAICPSYQPYSLDLLERKRGEIPRADEPHLPNAAAIGEGEAFPTWI